MSTAAARPLSPDRAWQPQRHRWTRAAYELAVAAGAFDPQGDDLVGARVELLDGEIVTMPPQGPLHVTAIELAADALRGALAAGGFSALAVRTQAPIALDGSSEPEPDLAVVRGSIRDYAKAHPTDPLLIIEISDASLQRDRTRKRRLYARNGVPEYWIVNLRDRQLEVLRDPVGDGYRQQSVHGPGERVAATALPGLVVAVADLLP